MYKIEKLSKVVQRHVWEKYKEEVMEEIRHSSKCKQMFPLRKETIERCFADGKSRHGLDYTVYTGYEVVAFDTLLIYAGMNIKKFVRYMSKLRDTYAQSQVFEH